MAAHWLIKSDPDEYSALDLERDGSTNWEGVRNAAAQLHLRAMRPGDRLLIYHTGDEKSVVAHGTVASDPLPDPGDPAGKRVAVQVRFGGRLQRPVPLSEIRADPAFAELALVRIGRLSVMPVSPPQWNRLLEQSERTAAAAAPTARPQKPRRRRKL
ncbi:MAG: EVE domain-containing protein [Phycisphaerales bacterium]|nr:EVE domain-containing protein [Phycisphaerales bacterium]